MRPQCFSTSCRRLPKLTSHVLSPARPTVPSLSASLGLAPGPATTPHATSAAAASLPLDTAASQLRGMWAEELLGPGGGEQGCRTRDIAGRQGFVKRLKGRCCLYV